MNPYNILGISEDSSLQEIKIAYKKKVLFYHPDKNKSIDALANFLLIKKSYELLIDNNFNKFSSIISIDDIDEFKFIIINLLKDMNIINKIFIEKHEKKYYLVIPKHLIPQDIDSNINNSMNMDTKFIIIVI